MRSVRDLLNNSALFKGNGIAIVMFALVLGISVILISIKRTPELNNSSGSNSTSVFAGLQPVDRNRVASIASGNGDVLALDTSQCSMDGTGVAFMGDSITNEMSGKGYYPKAIWVDESGASSYWPLSASADPKRDAPDSLYTQFHNLLNNPDRKVVVLQLGTNDCGGVSIADFKSNMNSIISQLEAKGKTVILSEIPQKFKNTQPDGKGNWVDACIDGGISKWEQAIHDLAGSRKIRTYTLTFNDLREEKYDNVWYHLHPTDAGYGIIKTATDAVLSNVCSGTPGTGTPTGTGTPGGACSKFGVNLLDQWVHTDLYSKITQFKMNWMLQTEPGYGGDPERTASEIAQWINGFSGGTTVVRFCYADPSGCAYRTAVTGSPEASGRAVADIINRVVTKVNKQFVVAPVNEPNSEYWAGSSSGEIVQFYNGFLDGIKSTRSTGKYLVASPTFNVNAGDTTTRASFNDYIDTFNAAHKDDIDLYTINVYDHVKDQAATIEGTLNEVRSKFGGKQVGFDEIGDFNHDLGALNTSVKALATDDQVKYALFFNAFGNSPNPDWKNFIINDSEWSTVLAGVSGGAACPTTTPGPTEPLYIGAVDPETAEYLNAPPHWNLNSCQVLPVPDTTANTDYKTPNSRSATSQTGELQIGLMLNPCSSQNDPDRTNGLYCSTYTKDEAGQHWTGGFYYTGGIRRLPIMSYLAANKATPAHNYTADCQLDSIRNFTSRGVGDFTLNFSNQFPGLGRLLGAPGSSRFVNIKVPLLGGAGACGIINWDEFNTSSTIPEPFIIHPLSYGKRDDHGGALSKGSLSNPDDGSQSLISILWKWLWSLTQQPQVMTNETEHLATPFCPNIPGGGIISLAQTDNPESKDKTDDIVMAFADEGGPFEYTIRTNRFDFTNTQICDYQFMPADQSCKYIKDDGASHTCHVDGAECKVDGYPHVFKGYKSDSLEQAGILQKVPVWSAKQHQTVMACQGDNPDTPDIPDNEKITICGAKFTCSDSLGSLYQTCRSQGGSDHPVVSVGGQPFLEWTSDGYPQTDLKALAKMLYNVWYIEKIYSPFKIIHNDNVGVETDWGIRVYDRELPKLAGASSKGPQGETTPLQYALSGTTLYAAYAYNAKLNSPQAGTDFNLSTVPNDSLKQYIQSQVQLYNSIYLGGYNRPSTCSDKAQSSGSCPDGISKADLKYYYPWLGQIPRMYERLSYFLSNYSEGKTYTPFNPANPCSIDPALSGLEINFCGCPVKNPKVTDCFATSDTQQDPLEKWLFSPNDGTGNTSGGGFGDPFQGVPATPVPSEVPQICLDYQNGKVDGNQCYSANLNLPPGNRYCPVEAMYESGGTTSCFQGPWGNYSHLCNSNPATNGLPLDLYPDPYRTGGVSNLNNSKWNKIIAPETGKITSITHPTEQQGMFVTIETDQTKGQSGLTYTIGHIRPSSLTVQVGQYVQAGQPLGIFHDGYGGDNYHTHVYATYQGKNVDPYLVFGQFLGCKNVNPPTLGEVNGTNNTSTQWTVNGKGKCVTSDGVLQDNYVDYNQSSVTSCSGRTRIIVPDPEMITILNKLATTPTPTPTPEVFGASTKQFSMTIYGDSNIDDGDANLTALRTSWAAQLEQKATSISGASISYTNKAVGKIREQDILAFADSLSNTDMVAIMIGSNDALGRVGSTAHKQPSGSDYQSVLAQFLDKLKAKTSHVFVVTLPYIISPYNCLPGDKGYQQFPYESNIGNGCPDLFNTTKSASPLYGDPNTFIDAYNAAIFQACQEPFCSVINVPYAIWKNSATTYYLSEGGLIAGLHITITGHTVIYNAFLNKLQTVVASLLAPPVTPTITTTGVPSGTGTVTPTTTPPNNPNNCSQTVAQFCAQYQNTTPTVTMTPVTPTPTSVLCPSSSKGDGLVAEMQKVADFINNQYKDPAFNGQVVPRVPWQAVWAISQNETHGRCTTEGNGYLSHVLWRLSNNPTTYTSPTSGVQGRQIMPAYGSDDKVSVYHYTDECSGDPNQVGMDEDGNEIAPQVRGITQWSKTSFDALNSNHYWEDYLNFQNLVGQGPTGRCGVVNSAGKCIGTDFYDAPSNSETLMEACLDYIGVNSSQGQESQVNKAQNPILNAYRPDRFSRARVGDNLCATAIILADTVAAFHKGYLAPDKWQDIDMSAAAAPYQGNCSNGYCTAAINRFEFAKQFFTECGSATPTPTPTSTPTSVLF